MSQEQPTLIEAYADKLRRAEERAKHARMVTRNHHRGLEVGLSVVVGFMLGRFVGSYVGYPTEGMYVGLVAGIGASVRAALQLIAEQRRAHPDGPDAPGDYHDRE